MLSRAPLQHNNMGEILFLLLEPRSPTHACRGDIESSGGNRHFINWQQGGIADATYVGSLYTACTSDAQEMKAPIQVDPHPSWTLANPVL